MLTPELLRLAKRHGFSDAQIGAARGDAHRRRARGAPRPGHPAGVQDRRHVRRGVRREDPVPLLVLRRGDRGRAARGPGGDHPGLRAEPHRPGHRVRLLVRARLADPARGRLRDDHDQLQPGDGLHRLRHLLAAVLRAADPRGRPGGLPRRARGRARSPGSSASSAGRPRWAWPTACRPPGCRSWAPPRPAIDLAEERGAFGRVLAAAGLPAPKFGMASSFDEAKAVADEVGYPVLVRPSYVLGGRGMEIVYDEAMLASLHRPRHAGQPGAPGAGRPLPRRRAGDRRRRALRRHRAVPRWRHGAHRGGRHPLR